MNKIIISVGLAAAGTAAFQMNCAAQSDALETTPKDWNVSAALRGFYDDNIYNAPNNSPNHHGSSGAEFSPTASASVPYAQTEIGFFYSYNLMYFQQREDAKPSENPYDQSHTFNFWLDHSFNQQWNVKVNNSFVVGQMPELLAAGSSGAFPSYQRLNGNNIANNGSIVLHTDWSRELSTELTYANYMALYAQSGYAPETASDFYQSVSTAGGTVPSASYAGQLNRIQNSVDLEAQWHLAPETMVSLGYQFLLINYTGNEVIGYQNSPDPSPATTYNNAGAKPAPAIWSDNRDNDSHIVYLGIQHNLLPNLVAAAKGGIQYNDYFNESTTGLSPYADLSVIYTYLPGCNAQIGFTQMRNASYVPNGLVSANGSLTLDSESSTVHASINHHFTPRFLGSVILSYSASTFNGGPYNNATDDFFAVGLSANYTITRNISAELDYNYTNLSAQGGEGDSFDDNRITIGLSVAY